MNHTRNKIPLFTFLLFSILLQGCLGLGTQSSDEDFSVGYRRYIDIKDMLESEKERCSRLYGDFEQQKFLQKSYENEALLRPYYEQAWRLRKASDSLYDRIDGMKIELIAETEEITLEAASVPGCELKNKARWCRPAIGFVFFWPLMKIGKAADLKRSLEEFRNRILGPEFMFTESDSGMITYGIRGFRTEDEVYGEDWENHYFGDKSRLSVLCELTRWQYLVREAEYTLLFYTYLKYSNQFYQFEEVRPVFIPVSNQVTVGEDFVTEIVLVGNNPGTEPKITINGKPVTEFNKGRGYYREKAISPGKKKLKGHMRFMNLKTWEPVEYSFETEYEVVE